MRSDADWGATVERARADGMAAGKEEGFVRGYRFARQLLQMADPSALATARTSRAAKDMRCDHCRNTIADQEVYEFTEDGYAFHVECFAHLNAKATELTEPTSEGL